MTRFLQRAGGSCTPIGRKHSLGVVSALRLRRVCKTTRSRYCSPAGGKPCHLRVRVLIEAARNQLREGLLADGLVEEAGELATASGAAK